jgi:hypothetical protein
MDIKMYKIASPRGWVGYASKRDLKNPTKSAVRASIT